MPAQLLEAVPGLRLEEAKGRGSERMLKIFKVLMHKVSHQKKKYSPMRESATMSRARKAL
jgi:hypothetical protein